MDLLDPLSGPALLAALDEITQGVLITDRERRITSCNRSFTELTGYSLQEMAGKTCGILQGPGSDAATVARIRDTLDRGERFSGEILNYRKNGESFWNELTISPVRSSAGEIILFIGVQRDVSSLKTTKNELIAATQRHRFLFDHVLAGIVEHAADTSVVYANATSQELLEMEEAEMVGKSGRDADWAFVREDGSDMPPAEYPVNQALATRLDVKHLLLGRRRHDTGSMLWLMCNAFPVIGQENELTGVVVSFTDVSALKLAEQAVRAAKERLQLVLRGSNDAPWDYDIGTGEVYYSPRWWEMIGFQPDELSPTPDLWRRRIHPEDLDEAVRRLDQALNGQATTYEIEFRLLHKDGHGVPVLARGFVSRDQDGKPIRVSGTNSDLTERKMAEERIRKLAFYDSLTGLPNRRLLLTQLQHALASFGRSKQIGALLFIDIDNFKLVNDSLGHSSGDLLLELVAARLKRGVREADLVARLGGDEFVVVVENLSPFSGEAALAAEAVGRKLLSSIGEPYDLQGHSATATVSIGVSLFSESVRRAEDALRQSDLAMYAAKSGGRNALSFFDPDMQVSVEKRMRLENDLRRGLERDELVLYYQPQVDAERRTIGAEVLVRWRHPEQGLISPAEFIPVAEASGLIRALGKWVIRSACQKLREWENHPKLNLVKISANVSAKQLHASDFVDEILGVLTDTGADPGKLTLELTESSLVDDTEETIAKMTILRSHGVTFSLDDFGTGYSSLRYLKRMPLSHIKIDRCFVQDLPRDRNDAAIAQAIIGLAGTLGLDIVAEGVETDTQREFLAQNGCGIYQGYLFGRPVHVGEFEASFA